MLSHGWNKNVLALVAYRKHVTVAETMLTWVNLKQL